MTKVRTALATALYCCAIWLALDFVYTTYLDPIGPSPRTPSAVFSHGFVPKFDGVDRWGYARYRAFTNSLGFRDASPREVPLAASTRRIAVIGDSFTEGLGFPFEQTFAGMLFHADQTRTDKVDFLNAGVVSYRPTIYYRKIRYWIEQGLKFDEVVVFPDISDIADESFSNLCLDDQKRLPPDCTPLEVLPTTAPEWHPRNSFRMSDRILTLLRYQFHWFNGRTQNRVIDNNPRASWTISGASLGNAYGHQGVEGGIRRSIEGMQALADLLRAHGIALTIAVYPWPTQLAHNDRDSRHVALWRDFCARNCKSFINVFPAFFAFKDAHPDWYLRLFIKGDVHFSVEGNALIYKEVARQVF